MAWRTCTEKSLLSAAPEKCSVAPARAHVPDVGQHSPRIANHRQLRLRPMVPLDGNLLDPEAKLPGDGQRLDVECPAVERDSGKGSIGRVCREHLEAALCVGDAADRDG